MFSLVQKVIRLNSYRSGERNRKTQSQTQSGSEVTSLSMFTSKTLKLLSDKLYINTVPHSYSVAVVINAE